MTRQTIIAKPDKMGISPIGATDDIIPLFTTSSSLKEGGIFTVEKAGAATKAGKKHGPISLCDLAKEEGLKQMHLVCDRWSDMMQAEKNLRAVGCQLVFGLKLVVCADMADKSEASFKTESKVVIWMNGEGAADYTALINLYTKAAQDGFYYIPRLDWKTLKAGWDDSLILSLPFYSSFLARNTLTFASIVPDMPVAQPLLLQEVGQELPIDSLIQDSVDRWVATNGGAVQRVKSIYYKEREGAKPWQVWRATLNRASWDKPQDGACSREFSYESYREMVAAEQSPVEVAA